MVDVVCLELSEEEPFQSDDDGCQEEAGLESDDEDKVDCKCYVKCLSCMP